MKQRFALNEIDLQADNTSHFRKPGKKILFATVPADGHVNPLTGLAVHLQNLGYDVRWYTSPLYADKLKKLQIQHYPFQKALDLNGSNLDEMFPERKKIKGLVKKLCFDMINNFVLRSVEYFEDIKNIYRSFLFDIVVCDCAFMPIPFIKEKMNIPVISIGVLPLTETSKDLAPAGLGLTPVNTFLGRRKQDALRFLLDKVLFSRPTMLMKSILKYHGLKMEGSNIFDMVTRKATLLLQSGTRSFEYTRSDLGKNIRFIGALLPFQSSGKKSSWYDKKLKRYKKVILVTQGTVEKDNSKLLVPTLEAFKNSDYLVIATTGGSKTDELKKKYAYDNIIIEDFIPFSEVMPYSNVYITNGGYGGVMLGIQNKLPMVVAGIHEGKAEINARVEYFKLGINLRTERPKPEQIKAAVQKIFSDTIYQNNVDKLKKDFDMYNPEELCTFYINEELRKKSKPEVCKSIPIETFSF